VATFGLVVLFGVGWLLGLVIGVVVFLISLVRGKRPFHPQGVICRGELVAKDGIVGPRLAGPALVRLSGALHSDGSTEADIIGLEIRMQQEATGDVRVGDQDLLLATFESFSKLGEGKQTTNVHDYLGNRYSTVLPWLVRDMGPSTLRLRPASERSIDSTIDRRSRLDADIAADRARLILSIERDGTQTDVAELRLIESLTEDVRTLRTSMFRQGRGVRPIGLRNGIRASVYPLSQLARALRGG
jgi:hypothetical protein